MEEEDKAFHNINFSYAETDFFTNKLKQAYPKIDTESLTNAIKFPRETERGQLSLFTSIPRRRGYDWIVFSRLPDKLSSNTTTTLCSDIEEDEDESGAGHLKTTHLLISLQAIM